MTARHKSTTVQKRAKLHRRVTGSSMSDAAFKTRVHEAYRQFWRRRGIDTDSLSFSGGFAG
jgi:hypothetical protein